MLPHAVRLFGRPVLELDGRRRYFTATQVDQLLAHLAFHGDWVTRDDLIFLFWPDRVDRVGRRNLRKLLHRARQESGGIEAEGDLVRWLVSTDVQTWREAMHEQDLQLALALCTRPLLEGLEVNATAEFGDWLEAERSQMQHQLRDRVVARCQHLERDAPEDAVALATALLTLDPLHERAVQCRLRALARAGRYDALEVTYRAFAERLEADVGLEPEEATRALSLATGLAKAADDEVALPVVVRPRQIPWGSTSFVARRTELAQLDECLSSALAGQGGVVAVEGEAGVGKTRLIEQFLSQAPDGLATFAARCYERDLSAPLEPIRTALDVWDDAAPARPSEELRFGNSEPRDRGNVLRDLTSRLLAAAAVHGGAILFIDDLQWADAATLEFLSYAANRVQDEPVLIVVSHRREDRSVLDRWRAALSERRALRSVRVDRFDADQTRALVAEMFGGDEGELTRFAEFVHGESEGNPFYVLEYLRWLRDAEAVEFDETRRITASSWARIEQAAVPESVRSLIWSRYRALGDHARSVLDVAAVLGRSFDFEVVERVTMREPLALWSTFEPLLDAGLLVAMPDGSFVFSHDKLRETMYESLGPPMRQALHASVAGVLDVADAGDAELAHHYLRARLWPQAYERLLAAARSAEAASAWEVALQAYQRTLALIEGFDEPDRKRFVVLQAMERLFEYMERRREWIDTIEQLSAVAFRVADPGFMAEAALKRMAMASVLGDAVGAAKAFEEANAIFAEAGDFASQARGYREVAYLAWMRGDHHAVLEASFEAARILERHGHRRALAATAENISHAYRWLGNEDEASAWADRAASIYGEYGDVLADYVRLDVLSWIHMRRGEDAAAAAVLERLIPITVQMEAMRVEKHMNLGKTYLAMDRIAEALQQFEAAARLGAVTGDPRHEGYPLMSVGTVHERLGNPEAAARAYLKAARLLEASYAITRMRDDEIGQGDALTLHGAVVQRRLDRPAEARASLTSAQRILRRSDDPVRLSRVQMELGSLHWREGELDAAVEAFREAVDLARDHGIVDREIAGLASLGVVYRDLGRFDESIALGRAAVERVHGRQDPLGAAVLLTSLAASYEAAGDTSSARECLERSLTLRREAGDMEGVTATRQALANSGS